MKRLTAVILAMLMIATPLSVLSVTGSPEPAPVTPFWGGGDGTPGNPYNITNVWELQNMTDDPTAHYALANDIDASATSDWNSGAGFVPVGTGSSFTGSLDGRNFTVSGLVINRSGENDVGLFGYLDTGSSVYDIVMLDVDISGNQNVGGIAGANVRADVYGTIVQGTVDGSQMVGGIIGQTFEGHISDSHSLISQSVGSNSGGIVGYNFDGSVDRCSSRTNIAGTDQIGGVAGYNNGGWINHSYSTGSVTGTGFYVGGLLGYNNGGIVHNTYSLAEATTVTSLSGQFVGGLVGYNSLGTIENSYSTGVPTGGASVGGLVGNNQGTVANCFWDTDTSGTATGIGGGTTTGATGGTTAEMLYNQTYITPGWDFTNVWWSVNASTRPFLRMEWSQEIRNSHQLQLMQMDLAANYTIMNDIDMTGYIDHASRMWGTNSTQGGGFVPVGNGTAGFAGSLDGRNCTINGLYILRPDENYIGLFGNLSTGSIITGVIQTDAYVNGLGYTAGFAGYNQGTIEDCHFSGTIYVPSAGYVGGIAGFHTGTISNCSSWGDLRGSRAGGIAGRNSGTLNDCDSHMAVQGSVFIGGLVGENFGGEILNSSASGDVSGFSDYVGGLVGSSSSSIKNCHAYGEVTTGGDYTGGLVGYSTGSIENSSAGGNVSGGNNVGGLVGYFDGIEISNTTSTGNVTGAADNVGGLIGYSLKPVTDSRSYGRVNHSAPPNDNYFSLGGLIGNLAGSTVSNSHAYGDVLGCKFYSGGLIGEITSAASVINSTSHGNVTGTASYIGGFVGQNGGNVIDSSSYGITGEPGARAWVGGFVGRNIGLGVIQNSSAYGDVLGSSVVGGFTGENQGLIERCYSEGAITGSGDRIGGFIGRNGFGTQDGDISDCYSHGNVSGNSQVGGLVGYNTGTIRASNATGNTTGNQFVGGLVGWNDGDIVQSHSAGIANGTGTIGGLVGENRAPGHIEACTAAVDVDTNDFAGGLIGFNNGTVNNSHATGSISASSAGGLIGVHDEGGYVNNSYAAGTVNGTTYCGGLIGWLMMSYINNSHATGAVEGGFSTGGLVGNSWKGDINNSYATGHVSGGSGVGGFIGENDGNVSRSYSTGDVSGETAVGGFVGVNTGNVSNSYAWGSITRKTGVGNTNLGGFVGYLDKGRVTNSYSIGRVSYIEGADPTDSGFAGATDPQGHTNMTGNYWDNQTSLQTDTQGNATGRNSWAMMKQATFQGWDFTDIWGIHEDKTYPFLRPFGIPAEPVADMEIVMGAEPEPVQLYGILTYTATLQNHGPDMATGVLVNVTLPAETSFEDSTEPFNVNGRYLELEAPNMPNGDTLVIFINASVNSYGTGTLNCTANVTSASNDPGPQTNETYVISHVNAPPTITTEDVTIATVGTLYSVQYEAEDPDDTNLTWSVVTELDHLTMTADGLLSGYLPEGGYSSSFQVNVTVEDGRGGLAWNQFSLEINYPPQISTEELQQYGTVGLEYMSNVYASDPDGDNLTWTMLTNADDWLTMDNGHLSGVPTASGTFWVNVTVDDGRGGSTSKNYTIEINTIPEIHTSSLPNATVNQSYEFQINASDADGDPLTWNMNNNVAWIQMNSTGYLSGTPSQAGDIWLNITVSDGKPGGLGWTWRNFTLTVEPQAPDDDDDEPGDEDEEDTVPIVIGPVLDADGDPISGATVTVTIGTDTYPGTTNATGHAIVNVPESAQGGNITVDITSEGHDPISYDTTLGDDGTPATQPTAMDETSSADDGDDEPGGIGDYLWIIIILVVVIVVALAAFMMMGRGRKPEPTEQMPEEQPAEEMAEEESAEEMPEETADEELSADVPEEEIVE